ncbi:MAG: hypothetical protein GC191_11505 [Azospirillum sp.]|nr:hypothetical protein [Azospirillum sp.]
MQAKKEPIVTDCTLSVDLLTGADEIAAFMFGDPKRRRQVYHLCNNGELPHFKLGALLCSTRSAIKASIAAKMAKAVAS